MARWISMVESFCADPTREEEFNAHYDGVRIPAALKVPGFVAARRYVHKVPRNGRGKYLTIYEIDTADIEKTMAARRAMASAA